MSLLNNLNSTERDINLSKMSEIIKKEKNHAKKSDKKENYYDDFMNENKLDKNEDWIQESRMFEIEKTLSLVECFGVYD